LNPRRVVAEIGSCNGDLQLAIDTAQAAIESGAWMVKGQMYRAETLTTRTAASYGHASIVEQPTQWEAFRKALTYPQWLQVADAVQGRFFASVFDLDACRDYPYAWIKTASADITYQALIEAAAATGKNLIVSTGASTHVEIHRALKWVEPAAPTLLACTLSYPTPPAAAHIRRMTTLREFHVPVGYSDHTRGILGPLVAFEYGATMVEKHFTITPGMGGDHDFAITPNQLTQIVAADPPSHAAVEVYGGSETLGPYPTEVRALVAARRSLRATATIPAGGRLTRGNMAVLRPTGGIDPWHYNDTLGRVTRIRLEAGDPVTYATLER